MDELKLKRDTYELLERSKVARMFKFYFDLRLKVNKSLNKFAKNQLELSNQDLKLLSIVKDERKVKTFAEHTLGIDYNIKHLLALVNQSSFKDDHEKMYLITSLVQALENKTPSDISEIIELSYLDKESRVDYLIGEDDTGMKNALSGVRNYWKTIRSQSKNWKRSNYKEYLIEAKTIIEEAFIKDEFTFDHFKRITTALYLAIKARLKKEQIDQ